MIQKYIYKHEYIYELASNLLNYNLLAYVTLRHLNNKDIMSCLLLEKKKKNNDNFLYEISNYLYHLVGL